MTRKNTGMLLALVLACTVTAGAQPYYTPDVTAIITKYGCAGCHGGSGGLNVTPYESIMSTGDHGPVVVPNDSNSVIVRKLKGTATFGSRMPLGGPYLTDAEIQVIVQWIMAGAQEQATTDVPAATAGPLRFDLLQNYPNPFNPSTTITFQLPAATTVRLTVHDITGREVALVLNERREAGQHTVTFSPTGLASGVYLYRLNTAGAVRARSMTLVR